jgi:hypothetical protein
MSCQWRQAQTAQVLISCVIVHRVSRDASLDDERWCVCQRGVANGELLDLAGYRSRFGVG